MATVQLEVASSGHGGRGLSLSVSMSDSDMTPLTSSSSRFQVPIHKFRDYVRDVLEATNDISFDGYDEELEVHDEEMVMVMAIVCEIGNMDVWMSGCDCVCGGLWCWGW